MCQEGIYAPTSALEDLHRMPSQTGLVSELTERHLPGTYSCICIEFFLLLFMRVDRYHGLGIYLITYNMAAQACVTDLHEPSLTSVRIGFTCSEDLGYQ